MDGTIIVTGASGALGQALAKKILQFLEDESCMLLFTVRNKNNAHTTQLRQMLDSHSSSRHTTAMPEVDLARPSSIRAFAADINSKVSSGAIPPIRALVQNAAFFFQPNGLQFTGPCGCERDHPHTPNSPFEMHFAVNHLANVLLSLLLLGSMDRQRGRIVYLSSWAHDASRPENRRYGTDDKLSWDVEELAHPDMRKQASDRDPGTEARRRYGASKLALATFMHALRKRLDMAPGLDNICIVGVDPLAMPHGNLAQRASWHARCLSMPLIQLYTRVAKYFWPNGMFRTVEKSAQDVLRAAIEYNAAWSNPKDAYFDGNKPAETAEESKDPRRQKKLWELSLRYVELEQSQTALGTDGRSSSSPN